MAGGAVGEAHPFFRRHFLVTIQAPAHVLTALRFCDGHLAEVAVTGFAAYPGGHVRAVIEVDVVRLDGNRNPGNGVACFDKGRQLIQFGRLFLHLLMAAPAFFRAGQAGGGTGGRACVAVGTLRTHADVKVVGKLDRLFRRNLGEVNAQPRRPARSAAPGQS